MDDIGTITNGVVERVVTIAAEQRVAAGAAEGDVIACTASDKVGGGETK